jgi:BMFP domain-containing protein YqiC
MDVVERLLAREEIDSLELDLARARESNDGEQICAISARIARLEAALSIARRRDVQARGCNLGPALSRAA